jgi:hypothetical protein
LLYFVPEFWLFMGSSYYRDKKVVSVFVRFRAPLHISSTSFTSACPRAVKSLTKNFGVQVLRFRLWARVPMILKNIFALAL